MNEEDELISVRLTEGNQDIAIATKNGYIIRFDENNVRSMGRNAAGVRGIRLRGDDEVVSMEIVDEGSQILHVTSKGVGKRTEEDQYRQTNRGGKGYFSCKLTDDTGHVVSVKAVKGNEDIMLITVAGVLIRIPVDSISITGRNTQGVRLIRVQGEEEVATVAMVAEEVEEEIDTEDGSDSIENIEAIETEADAGENQEESD